MLKMVKHATVEAPAKVLAVAFTTDPKEDHTRVTVTFESGALIVFHASSGAILKRVEVGKLKATMEGAAQLPDGTPVVVFVTASHLLQVHSLPDLKQLQSMPLAACLVATLDTKHQRALDARVGSEWRRDEADGGQHWLSLCREQGTSRVWLGLGGVLLVGRLSPQGSVENWKPLNPPAPLPVAAPVTGGGTEADAEARAWEERRERGRVRLLSCDGEVSMYLAWPVPNGTSGEKPLGENEEDEEEAEDGRRPGWLCVVHSETGLPLHSIQLHRDLSPGPGAWSGVAKLHKGSCHCNPDPNTQLSPLTPTPPPRLWDFFALS